MFGGRLPFIEYLKVYGLMTTHQDTFLFLGTLFSQIWRRSLFRIRAALSLRCEQGRPQQEEKEKETFGYIGIKKKHENTETQ